MFSNIKDYDFSKSSYNSYKTLIWALETNSALLTENQLMLLAFGYERTAQGPSNKKYADMLRRALDKGRIKRIKAKIKGNRSTYFYYVPRSYNENGKRIYCQEDIEAYKLYKKLLNL